jgi:hypothetical protein
LHLNNNGLIGSIPLELGQLSGLLNLSLDSNCLSIEDAALISFLDSLKELQWSNQENDCLVQIPLVLLEQQAVSVFNDKTGSLIIREVRVNGISYYAELQDQGGFQFVLLNASELSEPVHSTPADYSFDTLVVNIPSVFAFGRLYIVQMKDNGSGVFSVTQAE